MQFGDYVARTGGAGMCRFFPLSFLLVVVVVVVVVVDDDDFNVLVVLHNI